jgi:acyl-CoA synthetase (AMP-forming)/AMP-acid ligase II
VARSSEHIRDKLLGPAGAAGRPAAYEVSQDRWLTYGELREAVTTTAAVLAAPQKCLNFCFCENRIESLIGYLGSWSAGHAVFLADARLDASLRDSLVSLYRPDFLIAPHRDFLPDSTSYRLVSSEGPAVWRAPQQSLHQIHPDLALLLSTSGSTGSPKLVRLTYQNVVSNATQIGEALSLHPDERAITSLPLHYSYGLSVVNSHLVAGGSLVLTTDGLLADNFWSAFRTTACTSLAGIPYMYQMLHRLDLNALRVPRLKTMTQAGGKLQDNLIAKFHGLMRERDGRFFVMYGQTEATARIATLSPDFLPEKLGSVGKPLTGGTMTVVTAERQVTEPFTEGELVYDGPNVMAGYAECPEDLARGAEVGAGLYTGDLGYFDTDGFFYITGRNKRFSKVLGHRINLDEVESMLRTHGPTAVVAGSERLLIYCEYGDEPDFAAFASQLGEKLKLHPSLIKFHRVDSIPLNSKGKPDYQRLASA